ncbi:MAG TPA: hypothetical protein VK489_15890 [Ferruginibacter sp.]|nr:hypothetical protein [Ferruginibacter sp.]
MQNLQGLETKVLIDMLALYTEDYTRMISGNDRTEAFEKCREAMLLLQAELNSRNQPAGNTSISDSDIAFTPGTN